MKGCLRVVRGKEVKMTLPGPSVTIKNDSTLWCSGNPILGIEDPAEKTRIADLARSKKFDQIPTQYFTRLGNNPNGLWAGGDEAWEKHPLKTQQAEAELAKKVEQAKIVKIYLSSRGWGDYSSAEWVGDITQSDAVILAECKKLLANGYDVDHPNQSDDQLIQKIAETRNSWEGAPAREAVREKSEREDTEQKIRNGYCFSCDTYCCGDCGHYTSDPSVQFRRNLAEGIKEDNYEISD